MPKGGAKSPNAGGPKKSAQASPGGGLDGMKVETKNAGQRKRSRFNEDGMLVMTEEVEAVGFFEQMLQRQEEELLSRGEIEEEINEAFQVITVSSEAAGYEKDTNALQRPGHRVMKAKVLTEDKYNQAFKGGMTSMAGHSKDQVANSSMGVLKFSNKIKFQTRIHKERNLDYKALFEETKQRKNSTRVARQRQWASNWKEKYQPDGGVGIANAPWAK
jgi:hypothetical protein